MIDRRTILGLDFEKVSTESDFAQWCRLNGWESAAQFEIDTFIAFEQIKDRWFFIQRSEGITTVYARSIRGGVTALRGETQRHRG